MNSLQPVLLALPLLAALAVPAAGQRISTPPPQQTHAVAAPAAAGNAPPATPAGRKQQAKPPRRAKAALAGSPKHIFFVIPAYNVDYRHKFVPLSAHEKLLEWEQGAYDPIGLAAGAAEAGLEHSHTDGFCGYGSGLDSYGKCYGSALLDSTISGFFGDYLFPRWLHQDPRYFRLGRRAGFGTRIWYALSRVFIARTDSGGWTFASGATSGTVLAAVTSNLYYPQNERNTGHTLSRIYWDLGGTAIFNVEAEFWPDIKHKLGKIF